MVFCFWFPVEQKVPSCPHNEMKKEIKQTNKQKKALTKVLKWFGACCVCQSMGKLAWLVPGRSYWWHKSPALGDSPCLCSPGPTLSFTSLHPPGMAHHSSAQAEGWYSLVLLRSWSPSQGWFIHHICSWQMPPPKKTCTYLGAQLKL